MNLHLPQQPPLEDDGDHDGDHDAHDLRVDHRSIPMMMKQQPQRLQEVRVQQVVDMRL